MKHAAELGRGVQRATTAARLAAALALASVAAFGALTGCTTLGNGSYSTLPPDAHRKPTRAELEKDPCKHGDIPACIARCRQDDPRACNMVGVMLEFDAEGQDDPALASGFYRRACDATYGPGCNNLAWLYLRGRGVPIDRAQAMHLFYYAYDSAAVACLRGDASACALAGELLMDGRVEERDMKPVAFFERACQGGEARACETASLLR